MSKKRYSIYLGYMYLKVYEKVGPGEHRTLRYSSKFDRSIGSFAQRVIFTDRMPSKESLDKLVALLTSLEPKHQELARTILDGYANILLEEP